MIKLIPLTLACLLFCFCQFFEKKNGSRNQEKSQELKLKKNTKTKAKPLPKVAFEKLPPSFFDEFSEDWKQTFTLFQQEMENLPNLEAEGIAYFLLDVEKKIDSLRIIPLPEMLNVPPTKSRLNLVKMQLMKTRSLASEFKNDTLHHELKQLFNQYNALIRRMKSLSEENKIIKPASINSQ